MDQIFNILYASITLIPFACSSRACLDWAEREKDTLDNGEDQPQRKIIEQCLLVQGILTGAAMFAVRLLNLNLQDLAYKIILSILLSSTLIYILFLKLFRSSQ